MVNGAPTDDDRDAAELFPHTQRCIDHMRNSATKHGRMVPCVCSARGKRRAFLGLLTRTRRLAYVDAYAKIRHEARARAERALDPVSKVAFQEVAAWAENQEVEHLEG